MTERAESLNRLRENMPGEPDRPPPTPIFAPSRRRFQPTLTVQIVASCDEDHQKRHDCGSRIDDELPDIGPAKEWAGNRPQNDGQNRQHKSGRAAQLPSCCSIERAKLAKIERSRGSIAFVMLDAPIRHSINYGPQSRLNASDQQKNNDDQKQEAEAAARVISPAGAIRPGWQCAYQYKNQNDEEDRTKHCDTGAGSCS
jgi:hypothetical protein